MSGYDVCRQLKTDPATALCAGCDGDRPRQRRRKLHAVKPPTISSPNRSTPSCSSPASARSANQTAARRKWKRATRSAASAHPLSRRRRGRTILTNPTLLAARRRRGPSPLCCRHSRLHGLSPNTRRPASGRASTASSRLTRLIFRTGARSTIFGDASWRLTASPWPTTTPCGEGRRGNARHLPAVRPKAAAWQLRLWLNTGDATVGNIGSDKVMDYTDRRHGERPAVCRKRASEMIRGHLPPEQVRRPAGSLQSARKSR